MEVERSIPDSPSPIDDILDFDTPLQPSPLFLKDPSLYNPTTALAPITQPASLGPKRLKPKPKKENRYIDEIHNEYLESLGNATDLKRALARSESPKAQQFLAELLNPKNSKYSLTRLARRCDLSPTDIIDCFRQYHLSQATVEYLKAAPVVARDVVSDARTVEVECTRCDGFGEVMHPKPDADGNSVWVKCPRCKGAGMQPKPGSSDARKLMAEVVGWTKNKSAAQVTVNVNTGVESVIDEVESLMPEISKSSDVIDITPETE